ncbi:MAG TPA: hypothetical protein VGK25_11030, partial [Ignavibacteria bacterium]
GKDILYDLTFDDNYKIRASAINALGKINYDTNDSEFKNKLCNRLYFLINEALVLGDKKLYRKDIAFAFGNYKKNENIPYLIDMIRDDFYGVRFLAADALKSYGDSFFGYINESEILKVGMVPDFMNPFLYSLAGLSESNFKKAVEMVLSLRDNMPGLMFENVIETIKLRRDKSSDMEFIQWSENKIKELEAGVNLKVK